MSEGNSPVKRSSRTPKLSAKRLAFEEEVTQKKKKPSDVKSPVQSAPTRPKGSLHIAPPRKSKKRSSTSAATSRAKTPSPKKPAIPQRSALPEPEAQASTDEDDSDEPESPDPATDPVSMVVTEISSICNAAMQMSPAARAAELKRRRLKKGDGTGSDDEAEEKWLQALEDGKLEEMDKELKSIKDPKLMTARQRAVIESKQARVEHLQQVQALQEAFRDQHAMEQLTEESMERRAIKAAKRKKLAEAKRDKEKKETISRLLKKKDSKQKLKKLQKQKGQQIPKISYRYSGDGVTVSFPVEAMPATFGIDLTPKVAQYPTPVLCSNPGCKNVKKYQCSSNGLPVCSLACYKQVAILPPLAQLLEVARTTVAEAVE